MEEINNTGVTDLRSLRAERMALRMRADEKENELREHLHQVEQMFAPVQRILRLISGKRKKARAEEKQPGILMNTVQGIVSTIANRYAAKDKRRFRLLSAVGSFLGQGVATLLMGAPKKPDLRYEQE